MSEATTLCSFVGTISLGIEMEFATEEEIKELLAKVNYTKFSKMIEDLLEHTYDYTSRHPDELRVAWHEDGNRDAYLKEVRSVSVAVNVVTIHDKT